MADPNAAYMLKFWSVLDNNLIYTALEPASKPVEVHECLREITQSRITFRKAMATHLQFSLATAATNTDVSTYSIHPVVHDWSLDFLNVAYRDETIGRQCLS